MNKKQKILITSALPYANGPLHFGHIAGAYLPGDAYARFQRLQENDVIYICGSDEYGVAITLSAEMAGRTPKEHVDLYHEINKNFFAKMNFSFDHYSRTTWEGHVETVHQFFLDLLNNGYIEERVTDQLYSEKDHKFLADRYVIGTCPKCGFDKARGDECPDCGSSYEATDLINPRSKISNAPLIKKPSKHWFLLLDKFKTRLLDWLATKNWKPNVTNFIRGYINDLHARSITRDSTWGVSIPLPNTEGKILYVWFEALIGYISATKEWSNLQGDPDLWKSYWFDKETKLLHFLGKDNIPFHASIFPAMIMGQNQPFILVDELPANEFYKLEGRQFSKSDGWYIDLESFFKKYTTDQIRYTIAANSPETSDSEFTWKDFQTRCNSKLLGKYGNLVNRVLVFAKNNCNSKVPPLFDMQEIDLEFINKMNELVIQASQAYATFKLRRASQIIMELAQLGNTYFDAKKPWTEAKNPDAKHSLQTTVNCCLNCLKLLSLISFPIIPETANQVWNMLGFVNDLGQSRWNEVASRPIPEGQKILEPKILFRKIEDEEVEAEVNKLHEMANQCKKEKEDEIQFEPLKEAIDFDNFRNLDLRVGQIVEAENLPKSKKLLKLLVDLGFEKRTIVSGISQYYKPEEIIGKKVIVVANLKPAVLMGVESQGMLLAANSKDGLELLSIDKIPVGCVVS